MDGHDEEEQERRKREQRGAADGQFHRREQEPNRHDEPEQRADESAQAEPEIERQAQAEHVIRAISCIFPNFSGARSHLQKPDGRGPEKMDEPPAAHAGPCDVQEGEQA